jgi:hypothetical protein
VRKRQCCPMRTPPVLTRHPGEGQSAGAETVTVTRNEILTGYSSPEQYILAIVEVENG